MEETIYVIRYHRDKEFVLTGQAFRSEDEADDRVHELICEMMIELASDDELKDALEWEDIPSDRASILTALIDRGDVEGWASRVNECGQLYSWEEVVVTG